MSNSNTKVSYAVVRWSQDAQVKLPVTLLDQATEIRIDTKPNNNQKQTYQARFDKATGILMMRGGVAGEAWLPVLSNDNKWVRRVKGPGGLVEVVAVEPECE